jgi:multiple sugar transport system ATP-binding protein
MDMRAELKHLHHVAGATTIYVTHDQVEALTMSTAIAVMKEGVLQQVGRPDTIYRSPANLFVADFIGNPKVNLLEGVARDGVVEIGTFALPACTANASGPVIMAIRPEDITISREPAPGALECVVYSVLPAGADTTVVVKLRKLEITIKEPGSSTVAMDDKVWLRFNPDMINLYCKDSGNLLAA